MKITLSLISICCILFLLGGCNSSPTQLPTTDTQQSSEVIKQLSITGEVQEVESGKDGYTAKIVSKEGKVYWATISHSNLKENASQYRAVNVGETITVKGDNWEMDGQAHITVRELP
ncbi:hypothetical protein GXP67_12280 [Rhodocytophaga rosea]|uniref:DUF5666 domain-containing protein n=1 Tax=Rhodocytophaga rosea TaxID=2704465 RepID=A0A6C0GHI5_9BACT|nr:hypothetical protein [Rhodocytophaga rosea]QHT67355.1 hypothetical protein GXP67_12280 [Rhodocytophaga rosea]